MDQVNNDLYQKLRKMVIYLRRARMHVMGWREKREWGTDVIIFSILVK